MTMHTNPLSPLAVTLYPEVVSILTVARAETFSGAALLARATSASGAIMYSLSGGYLEPWAHPAAASKFASTRHAMSRIEILRIRVAVIVIAMDLSFLGLSARSSAAFPLPPGAKGGTPCDRSRSHHATVHRQDAAGRPAGLIRREIDRGLPDLLRLPQPPHRM